MTCPASNGCTGLCCAAFRLPHTIREVKARTRARTIVSCAGDPVEGDKLVDMLIPLTPKEARERNHEFGGDYEDRPDMCRRFPYEREDGCPFGCSCKGEAFG